MLAAVVIVAVAAGSVSLASTASSGTSYRTATVTRGSIQQTLTTTGVLSPVRSADVDFQVAGTVAKVRTAVGHKVVAGETLAWLDRSSLQATLGQARSELTDARERLSEDETSEDSATTSSTTGSATAATTTAASFEAAHPSVVSPRPRPSGSPGSPGSGSPHRTVTTATLTHDQQAIVAAQRTTDADLATAKTALATETKACAASDPTTPPTSATASPASLTCTQAASGLQHDQQRVNDDETAVDAAEQTLSRDLATATKALQRNQKGASSSGGSQRQSATRSTAARGSAVTITAADLATDQATIDTARAQVATAKASLHEATLTAPMSGKVTAVSVGKGDTVSGTTSSTSPAVEIVGSQQERSTVYLSDTQVRTMKVGLPAAVTPDGSSQPLTGKVVAIGVTGTESDSGSVMYPVTINIAAPGHSVVSGADAAVSITLATVDGVIAVPTSAVHYQGATTYVDLLTAGKLTRHTVTVSTVGPALTEVVSGLTVGQRVVLANLDAAVPSSSTTLTRPGFGGGFGGAGGFGGGFGVPGGFGGRTQRTLVGP